MVLRAKIMPAQKGFLHIAIIIVICALIVGAAGFIISKNSQKPKPQPTPLPFSTQPQPNQNGLKFDSAGVKSDPFDDRRGPFYHQILLAKSENGLDFAKEDGVLFDKASVPDAVLLPNGRLLLYAVDGARRSKSGIMVALSDDKGKTWDSGSMQLKSKAGTIATADPQIILLNDGSLRLYYIVFGQGMNQVKSAISTDGINFEEEDGVRFQYQQITDPDVVNVNGKWFMYLSQGPKLIATSSDNGLNFRLEGTIRQRGSVSKTVYVDVDFWRQFYCVPGGIKSARTSDGLDFAEEPGFRLEQPTGKTICDPSPIHLGGEWSLFYKLAN